MDFDFGGFISGLEKKARRAMPTAARRAYAPALTPGTIFSSAKPPVTVPGAILGLSGKLYERAMLPVAIYEQGRQVFNPQDNILTRLGDLGSGIRNLASGRPYLEGRTSSVQRPQMPGLPTDYKQRELEAGAAAEAFRPGAGFPGQQAAADRAYEAEKSRVAQLTAQDPELKRYADARKLAVAPGATPEQVQSAEDIGMQIWQQKYGNTPMGQPGGAVGGFNPLMDRTFDYQSGMSPQEMQAMQATAAPVQVAPGAVPYQKGDLGTRATLETGYDPAAYGLTPEKIEEMKQKLLQQAK